MINLKNTTEEQSFKIMRAFGNKIKTQGSSEGYSKAEADLIFRRIDDSYSINEINEKLASKQDIGDYATKEYVDNTIGAINTQLSEING